MEEELGARVCVLLGLERVEHHPEDREEEDESDDPGERAERHVDPAALADHAWRPIPPHAASSPRRSLDSTRSETVAMMIEKTTTTMLYADACPNSQPPPIDFWNTKYGT